MDHLKSIISSFEPISLEEMDEVKLMNRKDTKFMIDRRKLPDLLEKLKPFYRMLEVSGVRANHYSSLYYDTDDFQLYHKHQNGKLNRHKIRFRKYDDSNLCFLEIKFKSNKGRTIKKRTRTEDIPIELHNRVSDYIENNTPLDPGRLRPKTWIYFNRLTLVHKKDKERMTIDFDLQFQNTGHDKEVLLSNLVIAEVKQENFTTNSDFMRVVHNESIRPMRMSKYCIGTVLLYPGLKYNRFKKKLLTLNKLHYDTAGHEAVWKQTV